MITEQLAALSRNKTTEQLASDIGLKAQSIRKRFCETGSYYCLRPVKLPNGRLMWPANSIEQLSGVA